MLSLREIPRIELIAFPSVVWEETESKEHPIWKSVMPRSYTADQ